MGRLARVPHNVVCEVLLARKGLAADLAAEGRVVGVRPHVVGQVLLAGVLLAAYGAVVRRFT